MEVFVASHAPRPRMLIFGAIDFASALARQGAFLGYRVTVCDARPVFATPARFPHADEVVVDWPDRYLAAQAERVRSTPGPRSACSPTTPSSTCRRCEVALRLPEVDYIGVMGSRRTHDDRMNRLREVGLTDAELSRLASPIGLDLGARTPEETAVSIAAEIIARRWGGGRPLTEVAAASTTIEVRQRGSAGWPGTLLGRQMRKTHLLAAVVIALGTATALAAPASADDQLDQAFLKGLQQKGVTVKSDQWALDLAHSTCDC